MDIQREAHAIAQRIIADALKAGMGNPGVRSAVQIRTYSDAETYAMLGPQHEHETWALHQAINRCLTIGFQRYGVAVEFVVLESAAYRRWLRDRADTAGLRKHYATLMEHAFPTITIEPRVLH